MASTVTGSFTLGAQLDRGGEADVFRVIGHPDLLIKKFRKEPVADARRRIDRIIDCRNWMLDEVAAWPRGWEQVDGHSALVLPFVTDAQAIHVLFDRETWAARFPDATWAFMVDVARAAAAAVATIHATGLAVVDINEKNMLVGKHGKVTLIDCDSFVFLGQNAASISPCFSPGWPPPELMPCLSSEPRTADHDNFSLARLIFHLLFAGRAPLEAVPHTNPDEDPRRIFGFSEIHPVRAPSPGDVALSDLPPRIAGYFERAFLAPALRTQPRPTAQEWADALTDMRNALQPCSREPQHWYFVGGGRTCPWCRMAALSPEHDPFRSLVHAGNHGPSSRPPPPSPPKPPPAPPPPPPPPPSVTGSSSTGGSSFEGVLTSIGYLFAGLLTLVRMLFGLVRFGIGLAILAAVGWIVIHFGGALLHAARQTAPPAPVTVEQRAADFATSLSADFSRADASEILDRAYAPTVYYFKAVQPHSFVMQQKNGIITRWPRRNYVPRPGSVSVECDKKSEYCTVSLITDYQVTNDTGSKSGSWASTMLLDMRKEQPIVIGEDGRAAK